MIDKDMLLFLYRKIDVDPVLDDGALLSIQELPIDRTTFIAELMMLAKALEENVRGERTLSGVFYTEKLYKELVKDPYAAYFTNYDGQFVTINESLLLETLK
ncbi:hypothetical protein [Serratia marcescens]|uniref:hypothetical protein n=1 Tax=Serratia marcescens TaxID=615 RepID=UPI0006663BC4|nr:hypothetical protein [Serratia marcescens]BEN87049.1 hypothetical protein SMQC07_08480 [Serratia marcescens]BEN92236.1 hypothetical protein SMQC08_08490 [Serratia marcescens]BEN97562.1 hypothetical protein SMQC11_08510 [Serratia marcescens]